MGTVTDLLNKGAGMTGNLIGGVASAIAASKQIKEAKKQAIEGRFFNAAQEKAYGNLYSDLISKAEGMKTYKGDTSAYQKVVSEAERQKAEGYINPADAMLREDARLGTANYIGAASRGARSAADLMSIAGNAQANENAAIRGINTQNAQDSFSQKQRSSDALLTSLNALANATARERGLEFESLWNKDQGLLSLNKEKGLGGLDMAYRNKQEDFQRRAVLINSQASAINGVGDVFRSIGEGYTNYHLANNQMDLLKSIYAR
jgi:hypothetical protein